MRTIQYVNPDDYPDLTPVPEIYRQAFEQVCKILPEHQHAEIAVLMTSNPGILLALKQLVLIADSLYVDGKFWGDYSNSDKLTLMRIDTAFQYLGCQVSIIKMMKGEEV